MIEIDDEIPFARRVNPIRRFDSRKVRLIAAASVFITFFASLLITRVFFSSFSFVEGRNISLNSSNDDQLLGHFKYPEAQPENLVALYPGFQLHKDTMLALKKMRDAAYLDGVELVFLSGYRSIDLQREIFYENKSIRNQIAIQRSRVSAPPGYSEHSTGYAVDIGDRKMRETDFEVSFEGTPAFRWLMKNAAKYHFVLSFPRNNSQKVSYEPWHWRFEGTVDALKQFDLANQRRMENEYPK